MRVMRRTDQRTVPGRTTTRRRAFSLLELMIVVAVIAIIIAIAIPAMTSSRKHANESSAISSLRTYTTAQVQYRTRYGAYAVPGDLTTGGFVDNSFADSQKSGYLFTASGAPNDVTWDISAQPVNPGVTGNRWFRVDESGVIRFKEGGLPAPSDPAVD